MILMGKGPEGFRKAKEELERFNEELRKGSPFSREAIETIEAALLSPQGPHRERIKLEAVERLLPGILVGTEKHLGKFSLTDEEASADGKEIADFILKGGKGPIAALGIVEGSQAVKDWMKQHYGVAGKGGKLGKPEEYTPAMAAEYLRHLLGGSAKDLAELQKSVKLPEAQPAEAARAFNEMATRLGTSMKQAFEPVARMMNIIMGDDPSGKGSPLDRFLDNIDTRTKEFDNWVRTNFSKTWKDLEETFKKDWAAIQPLFNAMHAIDTAAFKGIFDSITAAPKAFGEVERPGSGECFQSYLAGRGRDYPPADVVLDR
jgi:hypothetical protein